MVEQDLTTQVMDSMDMMFGVLSNGQEDVDEVKITLSKSVIIQLFFSLWFLNYRIQLTCYNRVIIT